jgi:RecA-family ATPase
MPDRASRGRLAVPWLDDDDPDVKAAREQYRQSQPNGHAEAAFPPIDQADVARWRDIEPPELVFTIADLVPQGMVTLLTGQGGAGKTLILQTIGTGISANKGSVLGKNAVSGSVAGLFGEDPEAVLHARQPRINAAFKIDYDTIAGRYFPKSYFGLPAQLWRQGRPTRFFDELEAAIGRIDNPRLLTLDNAAVLFSGDENSRPEVTEFLSALNGLADRRAIAIILSAHPSKSQDGSALRVTSGSTAWVNACRSVLELRTAEGEQGPSLVAVKANHAATGTTIDLEWRDKLLLPIVSSSGVLGTIERRVCDRVFLDLLDATKRQGRNVSDSKHASNYAPKIFAASPNAERYIEKDFRYAMERLFATNQIHLEKYGRKADERTRIARLETP